VIDWLTFLAPCHHAKAIDGGQVLCLSPEGELQWMTRKRAQVRGSFDDTITIRTATHTPDPCTHLEISGNPVKFFQGHNLWGSDDVHALMVHTMQHFRTLPELELQPTPADLDAWKTGDVRLLRVDQTASYHLNNRADVLSWLRAAEQSARLTHRGRGQLCEGTTLYFGKHSRRWSLKLYAKGEEIRAKGHQQHVILQLPHALAWADRTLRAELVLRSMELRRLELDTVSAWIPRDGVDSAGTERLLLDRLGAMTMNTVSNLPAATLDELKPAIRMAFQTWKSGTDLRAVLPRRTFYTYRAALLPHGIDIATVNPAEQSNVVPLVRVLEAMPAGIPDWAHGTPLYWEPRRVA
jgi:II/X family phage/plasmid replication protein